MDELNSFEQLKVELGGIVGATASFSNDPISRNYVDQLKIAVESGNYGLIIHVLTKLEQWYSNQYSRLAGQPTKGIYNKVLSDIKTIKATLKKEDCVTENTSVSTREKAIFLSHKSDDKKYGDALRNFIIGLGVSDQQLIYSSHPLNKIPLGENIFDYLRNHINSKVFMIILWSDKYLESPACLNEMGAAWVVQADYTNLYVPDFHFGNPKYHQCAVDTRKMGAILNGDSHCKESLIELKDKILAFFNLPNDEKKNNYLLDQFVADIQ